MIPRGSRWALCCLALLLSLSLFLKGTSTTTKGRIPAETAGDAAFLPAPAGCVTVRLAGDLPRPGLYRFPDGASLATAIKMTLPGTQFAAPAGLSATAPLAAGHVYTLMMRAGKIDGFSKAKMPVKERMLLGIPLNPDQMGIDDWACLPGIGPALSARIVAERHNNGAFGALDGLLRVPGIGPGKLAAIRRYF